MDSVQDREKKHFDELVQKTGEIWWGSATQAGKVRKQRRAELISREIERYTDPYVLEVGCGTGAFSQQLLEIHPDLHFIGCDVSPKAIEEATVRCNKYSRAKFEALDATNTGLPADSVDVVVGASILHHLPLEPSLREINRLLKPGGLVCFSEPNMMNPHVFIEKNVRFVGKMLQSTEDETAFFRWDLFQTLSDEGFVKIKIIPFDFLHPAVPGSFIKIVEKIGSALEKTPLLKELAGSLFITAEKPKFN